MMLYIAGDPVSAHMEWQSEWLTLFLCSGACGPHTADTRLSNMRLSTQNSAKPTSSADQLQSQGGKFVLVVSCLPD